MRVLLLPVVLLASCGLVGPDSLGSSQKAPQGCDRAHPYGAGQCYMLGGWLLEYSPNVVLQQTADGPAFDVPVAHKAGRANPPHVGMLTKAWPGAMSGTITVTLRLDTTGVPLWISADPGPCPIPISARIWMATTDWGNSTLPDTDLRRWWSHTGYLALGGGGTFTFSASLDTPSQWGNVWDHNADESPYYAAGFNMVKTQGGRIGLVFGGGGCSYGHGVYLGSGTARVTVLNYAVN